MTLTPRAVALLDALAKKHNVSRSEAVEQLARGLIYPEQPEETGSTVALPLARPPIFLWEPLDENNGGDSNESV